MAQPQGREVIWASYLAASLEVFLARLSLVRSFLPCPVTSEVSLDRMLVSALERRSDGTPQPWLDVWRSVGVVCPLLPHQGHPRLLLDQP